MTNPVEKLKALKLTIPPEGDLAEFGVFDGLSTKHIAAAFKDRTVWAFDTFEGMPKAERGYIPELDSSDPPGKFKTKLTPEQMFKGFDNIRWVKGVFEDTLPTLIEPSKLAFVHIDCDWYKSHGDVFEFITPKLITGSVVILDDYQLKGAKKATDEWVKKYNKTIILHPRTCIVW